MRSERHSFSWRQRSASLRRQRGRFTETYARLVARAFRPASWVNHPAALTRPPSILHATLQPEQQSAASYPDAPDSYATGSSL